MYKLRIQPQWLLNDHADREQSLQQVLELLTAVHEEGNLAKACRTAGLSYRHAWGLVRQAGETFGAPLLNSTRGQGAKLSPLGEKLVWANQRFGARLSPLLDSLASELETEIQRTLSHPKSILRIHASHAFALDALRTFIIQQGIPIDLKYRGSTESLASLGQSECGMAGFHVPVGEYQADAVQHYRRWLKPRDYTLVNVVTRRQGIMVAAGNPKKIVALPDLAKPGVRYVNRQTGSGTRLLLDLMLKQEKIDGRQIAGFDSAEFTHAAVAAYIASDMADAGLGVETAARKFHLGFVPLLHERYFLAVDNDVLLESPAVGQVIDIMRSPAFKAHVNDIPGLDATLCGSLLSIQEAFPGIAEGGAHADDGLAAALPQTKKARKAG